MSALDPVDVWVDLFSITEHPPTDSELEEFGQAFEQAVRAAVAAEIDSVGHHWSGAPALAFFALATDIREGKQP